MVKSFDIRPKVAQKLKIEKKIEEAGPTPRKIRRPRRKWPKIAALMLLAIILLLWFISFYVLPEARIEVVARSEPVARDFEIRVDKNQAEPNFAELAIPGKILEVELEDTKTSAATGAKNIGQKASGFVYLYNFSKTTLILKAATTELSANGRKYFFTQDVANIRPTALIGLEDQEVDPSSLIPPVPVAAEAAGPEYNLPKNARLEISNEAFGQNPKTLYAVAEDISGGTTKEVKVVTQNDISRAYQSLSDDLIRRAKHELLEKYGAKALDNAMAADVLEPRASASAGTEASEFQVSAKVRVRAFVFDEREVKSIVVQRIKRLLPENKVLEEGESARFSTQFANVSLEQGLGILIARYEGRIIYQVDREGLVGKLKGKNVEEMKEILLSRPEVESAKIKFYPFWVKRAPKLAGKIKLEVTP